MTALATIKPLGVRKAWEREFIGTANAGQLLVKYYVPDEWGVPNEAVSWIDEDDALRVLIADYSNGRRVTLRKLSRGFKVSFGQAA